MRLSRLVVLGTTVIAIAGVVAPVGSAADFQSQPALVGEWLAPFAEDPTFAERPPATKAESAATPTAVSIAVSTCSARTFVISPTGA